MQQFIALALGSAGVGVGIFVGLWIGLSIRARKGVTEGLIAGSVPLTAFLAGLGAMAAMMLMKVMWG